MMCITKSITTLTLLIGTLFFSSNKLLAQDAVHHQDQHLHKEQKIQEDHVKQEEHMRHKQAIESHDAHTEDTMILTDEQIAELGLKISKAKSGSISISVSAPGETVVNEDSLSHISARFPGIVKTVKKKVGDTVRAGEALAIVESNESLSLYTIKSLIDGVVIEKHATIGELLREEDTAFSVADLSTVWINLNIYQVDLPLIKTEQTVKLSQGHRHAQAIGKISYVSPVVDEETRTAVARVVIDNPDSTWRPGLFVTGDITVQTKDANIVLESSSIQTIDNRPHVFIKSDSGFRAREIQTGITNSQFVEVLSGLESGEEYVAENGFVLKAELSKSSFGDGHDH